MQSRTNNTGYFVAVDGPNGSGKTTVICLPVDQSY